LETKSSGDFSKRKIAAAFSFHFQNNFLIFDFLSVITFLIFDF